MSAMLCYYGMRSIYDKWQNTPTITSIEDTNYAVWNINFPAVTICSNNKAFLLISLFFAARTISLLLSTTGGEEEEVRRHREAALEQH